MRDALRALNTGGLASRYVRLGTRTRGVACDRLTTVSHGLSGRGARGLRGLVRVGKDAIDVIKSRVPHAEGLEEHGCSCCEREAQARRRESCSGTTGSSDSSGTVGHSWEPSGQNQSNKKGKAPGVTAGAQMPVEAEAGVVDMARTYSSTLVLQYSSTSKRACTLFVNTHYHGINIIN